MNQKAIVIIVAAIVIVGGGVWYYQKSAGPKNESATGEQVSPESSSIPAAPESSSAPAVPESSSSKTSSPAPAEQTKQTNQSTAPKTSAEANISCASPTDTSRMDIFDSHVHMSSTVDAPRMILEMNKAGVSVANLYSDASHALEAISQYPGRFITFVDTPEPPNPSAWLTQGQAFITSTESQLKTGKFYGVGETNLRLSDKNGNVSTPDVYVVPDTPLWLQLVDLSARYHVPISFHFVPEDTAANAAFERMLNHNKNATLIWAHLGFNQMALESATLSNYLLRYPHLYFDTAGIQNMQKSGANWDKLMPNGQLDKDWKKFFETWNSRILFGTDAGGGGDSLERWLNYSSDTSKGTAPNATGHWRSLTSNLDYNSARNILSANARELFLKKQKPDYNYSVSSGGKCYSISVSSKSSVSALTFNQSTRAITFTVADSNGTAGSAVVTIPIALGKNFTASVDGQSVKSQSTSNSANTIVNLEYSGGIRTITLVAN
ncbi:MAG: hypothetical protein Q8Q46_01760 [Candidatus Giovannonibacteria bacterium]|nr:hypothetical protein [Candidatus Giovannonibacteria bacterium]